jgi:hypothetical protein
MLLDVGVATVVIDHAVQVDVADPCPLLGAGQVSDAGDRMPGAIEARQAGDVDVKQGSGPRPLMATIGLPGSSSAERQRCHQRWAVAGATQKAAAAAFCVIPDSIACTNASLPDGPRAASA